MQNTGRRLVFFAVVSLLSFSSACSTVEVSSERNIAVDLARYRTFDWAKPPTAAEGKPAPGTGGNSILDKRIKANVESSLAQHGVTKVAPGSQPDFVISYFADVENRVTTTNGGVGMGPYGGYGYPMPETYVYREGQLTLNFRDAKNGKQIWLGHASAVVDDDPAENDDELKEGVQGMIAEFQEDRSADRKSSG